MRIETKDGKSVTLDSLDERMYENAIKRYRNKAEELQRRARSLRELSPEWHLAITAADALIGAASDVEELTARIRKVPEAVAAILDGQRATLTASVPVDAHPPYVEIERFAGYYTATLFVCERGDYWGVSAALGFDSPMDAVECIISNNQNLPCMQETK